MLLRPLLPMSLVACLVACAGGERPVAGGVGAAPGHIDEPKALAVKAGVPLDPTGRWKSIDADGAVTSVQFRGGTVQVDTGCNPLGADYTAHADGTIEIGPVRRSKRYCPGRMASEKRMVDALNDARVLRRDRARLELLDAGGNVVLTLDAESP